MYYPNVAISTYFREILSNIASTIFRQINKSTPLNYDFSTFLALNESISPCSQSRPFQESTTSLNKIRRKGGF